MKQNDYQKIRETLSSQCTAAIQSFAVTPDNKDVYAFCIYCDAGNGLYSIALNTQDAFEKRVAEVYSNYADIDLHGFCGVKYNPPDFRFFGLQSESSRLDQLCDRYRSFLEGRYDRLSEDAFNRLAREHETLFVDQAVAAILGAEREFSQLRRTDDFVAFVSEHDVDEVTAVSLFRRTVSEERFAQLFPELLQHEQFRAELSERPVLYQVSYWQQALVDLALERASPLAARGVTKYDAIDELGKLGHEAAPAMLDLVGQFAGHVEFNEKGSPQWQKYGAFTLEADLTHLLLMAVGELGCSDSQIHDRLLRLLRTVWSVNRGLKLSGLHPSLTARALHTLFPSRYPAPHVSDRTNHLLNPESFGL